MERCVFSARPESYRNCPKSTSVPMSPKRDFSASISLGSPSVPTTKSIFAERFWQGVQLTDAFKYCPQDSRIAIRRSASRRPWEGTMIMRSVEGSVPASSELATAGLSSETGLRRPRVTCRAATPCTAISRVAWAAPHQALLARSTTALSAVCRIRQRSSVVQDHELGGALLCSRRAHARSRDLGARRFKYRAWESLVAR
mmetsp:Transcript_22953/g.48790  ORF Transcript_22953/g.48790 Transcript_22953/m.48790 type:complete len:200 (+) Transcript_22953:690-1289(+)